MNLTGVKIKVDKKSLMTLIYIFLAMNIRKNDRK